jgi:hypothetical protein
LLANIKTEKLENSALNMSLVVNEPEEQEFSLKNRNFSGFWDLVGACMVFSPVSKFFGWSTIKINGKTQKLSSNMVYRF